MKFCYIRILFVFGLLLSETNGAGETSVIIAKNSVWKYAVGSQYPDLLWNQPAYGDSAWLSGPGVLGYGEVYISTPVSYGPDAGNKYITTCFRHSFQLGLDPSQITTLTLLDNYDDGFVAYLNGQEIVRRNMSAGAIDFSILASSHEGGIYESIDITLHKDKLVMGTNLLAVEVHQSTASSSDLVWDAELSVGTSQVQFVWSGAVTATSARVKAKLIQDNLAARLAVGLDSILSSPAYSLYDTALTAENNRVVDLQIEGLTPNQQYHYAVEVGGILDLETKGRFHTFPAGAASFKFALGSCALTASNHQVFQTILSKQPLFFFHLGDFHYLNIGINDRDLFRQGYETVLASPNQSQLYRNVPIAYIWDDHDYGPNNSDSTAPGRLASRMTYQEYVPHYPLAFGSGDISINQSFTVGRVKFIVCDSRSARSPAGAPDDSTKTVLGSLQKDWFKQELLDSKDNYPLMVWVNTFPWIGTTGDDAWNLYTNERRELADFLKDNNIHNLCMISGDAHMLAIDDGTNSGYATGGGAGFPLMHAAALDQVGSLKGGPYSQGAFPGGGQFGIMTINDSGESLKVEWSGRNYLDEEIVSYSFTVPGNVGPACVAKPGDATADDTHTLGDLIAAVNHIFSRPGCSPLPLCWISGLLCRGDWNGSGTVTLGDVIWGVNYIFNKPGGPWPPVPSGVCCLPVP